MLTRLAELSGIKSVLNHLMPMFHLYRLGNFKGYRIVSLTCNGFKAKYENCRSKTLF